MNFDESLQKLKNDEKLFNDLENKRRDYIKIISRAKIILTEGIKFYSVYPEYKFPLMSFMEIFTNATTPSHDPIPKAERAQNLLHNVTTQLCNFIEQSMDKPHKILFAFSIYIRILESESKMNMD